MDVLLSCLAVCDQLVVGPQTYFVVRRVPPYSCICLPRTIQLRCMTKIKDLDKKDGDNHTLSLCSCDAPGCSAEFQRKMHRANETDSDFCSEDCLYEYQQKVASKRVTEWVDENGSPNWSKGSGITSDGYVWIYVTDRERNQYKLHRYLMEAKIGRRLKQNEVVHHKDGNKLNNSLENLQLMTRAEHNQLHFSGSGSGNSKLTEKDVREIRSIAENTDRTKTSIANEFDISLSQASKIIHRDAWKHVD